MFKRLTFCFLCVLLLSACAPASGSASPLVIDEHLLSGPPDLSTDQLVFHFAQGDQAALLARTQPYRNLSAQALDYNRRLLRPFGYDLIAKQTPEGGAYLDIYHGSQLVAQDVITLRPASVNASHTSFVALADLSDGTYLFTPDRFELRDWFVGRQPYGYVGDRLLSLEIKHISDTVSQVDVYLDDAPAYNARFNAVSVYGSFDGPWTYDTHWALALLDSTPDGQGGWNPASRLILDGQDLNSARGYEQSFQFSLLGGKPFYFYQKSGKIGLSFDGQELAKGYDELPHYNCCTGALTNPGASLNMVWFFARRGADWYYVEAYLPPGASQ